MVLTKLITNPREIVAEGERIYKEKYQKEFEAKASGQFVAIDVMTGKAYLASYAEEALDQAKRDAPNGIFHLIKIGASGAFKVSYSSNAARVGIFR